MKSCSWLSFLLCFRTKKAKKAPAPPAKEEKPKLTIFEEEVDPDEGLFGPEKDFASVGTRRKMTESKSVLYLYMHRLFYLNHVYNWAFKLQWCIVYRLNNDLEMLMRIFSWAESCRIIQKE